MAGRWKCLASTSQECRQKVIAKLCSLFFLLLAHRGFILSLEILMLIHSSAIHFCIYFPYFLPYFILLPEVTYMETEIF